ncbi:MAG TPA: nucleoside recognition domain-containing protein [Paludibacter sp.]
MILNYIWIGFLVIAFIVALVQLLFFGNTQIFSDIMTAAFGSAKSGFEVSLGLTGALSLWLGVMKIGEKGGVLERLSRVVAPFFVKIFPEIPKGHPALASMFMNLSATMLGLDNAATPMGLKAMREMQELNTEKDRASNSMILFLVLNTAGLTLIPISVMVYRAQLGAVNPADIFIPILLATFIAFIAGLISVAVIQRINLFNRVVLGTLGGISALIGAIIYFLSGLPKEQIAQYSSLAANFILFSIIISFITMAIIKKVNVYDSFIEGAKEGFQVAIGIIPYLIAILVAIGMFRASGALNFLTDGIRWFVGLTGINTEFVDALPTAFMKPLSGSGARGMMIETMKLHGADSFVGRLSSIIQGSTDTTFYIIAVYFGSVGIKNTRYAILCGLFADAVGITAAILLGYLFFH